MNQLSLILLFAVTTIIITLFIEVGYRIGRIYHRKDKNEKESPVSAISGSILGLLVFMLAFTFGIVSDKLDSRKDIVWQEANSIATLWIRTDFLPEPDRTKTRLLIRKYVDLRLDIFETPDETHMAKTLSESAKLQQQMWAIAVLHSRTDLASDVGALYFESLNTVINDEALRLAVAYQKQIPSGIWIALYCLLILGMISVGYATAAAESSRSIIGIILALSFSVVITLIAAMDSPLNKYISVSQKPMEDVRQAISEQ